MIRNVFGLMMFIPVVIAALVGIGLVGYVIIDALTSGYILGGLGVLLIVTFFTGFLGLMFTQE